VSKPDLDRAYALETPEDSVKLYGDWAESYDTDFAESSGYLLPEAVAAAFHAQGGRGPVLDLGAGTGLVGEALARLGVAEIDGTDISAQMLAEAALKDVYDNLFEGDLTAELPCEDGHYVGIVSAGTFTHGHVGPEAFDEVLRVAADGALICLTVNAAHYEAQGFAAKLEALAPRIQGLTLQETPIYDARRSDGHGADTALIVSFRNA
jgi:predicted TPR repeat methyltransferase